MTATAGTATDPFMTKGPTGGALAAAMGSAELAALCRLLPMSSGVLECRNWLPAKEQNKNSDA
jgi:hypothetical protein